MMSGDKKSNFKTRAGGARAVYASECRGLRRIDFDGKMTTRRQSRSQVIYSMMQRRLGPESKCRLLIVFIASTASIA